MYRRLGSATLSQLAFPEESQQQKSCATQARVHAGCFSVSIIHWALTWSTGSLGCTQMWMHMSTHGQCMGTVRKSALKVDSGRKVPCLQEIEAASAVCWSTLYQPNWATSPPQYQMLGTLGGGGGGFLLACEDLGRLFDNSLPACTFFFFFF